VVASGDTEPDLHAAIQIMSTILATIVNMPNTRLICHMLDLNEQIQNPELNLLHMESDLNLLHMEWIAVQKYFSSHTPPTGNKEKYDLLLYSIY